MPSFASITVTLWTLFNINRGGGLAPPPPAVTGKGSPHFSMNMSMQISTHAEEFWGFAGRLPQSPSPLQPYHGSGDDATSCYQVVTWLVEWLKLSPGVGTTERSITDGRGVRMDGDVEWAGLEGKASSLGRNICGGHWDKGSCKLLR